MKTKKVEIKRKFIVANSNNLSFKNSYDILYLLITIKTGKNEVGKNIYH